MSAAENKRLVIRAFDRLADGDRRAIADLYADDVVWTMMGTTPWSGRYEGRDEIRRKLMEPLFAQFGDIYTNRAQRFIAADDIVVVECRGRVTTKKGVPYNNEYCLIYRFEAGKIVEITEYLDTALVERALDPPFVAA